jgi:hypothetical protein
MVYVVNGNDGQPDHWDVLRNPKPEDVSTWTTTQLDGQISTVPSGLAARGNWGATVVLLVGVPGSGIWQYTSGSGWQRRTIGQGAMQDPAARASTAWLTAPGSLCLNAVFLYDNYSGLWRSCDNGVLWAKVWSHTTGHTGYLAADPAVGNRLYMSVEQEGVWRIDGADQATITPTPTGTFTYPGPIAVNTGGTVYVTEFLADGAPPKIWYSPLGGTNWTEVSDTVGVYKGSGYVPVNLVAASDGRVYVAVSAGGVIIGTPP